MCFSETVQCLYNYLCFWRQEGTRRPKKPSSRPAEISGLGLQQSCISFSNAAAERARRSARTVRVGFLSGCGALRNGTREKRTHWAACLSVPAVGGDRV